MSTPRPYRFQPYLSSPEVVNACDRFTTQATIERLIDFAGAYASLVGYGPAPVNSPLEQRILQASADEAYPFKNDAAMRRNVEAVIDAICELDRLGPSVGLAVILGVLKMRGEIEEPTHSS